MPQSYVGRGLSFPLRLNDRDRLSMVQDDADIRQSIQIIIMTIPGERVMRPNFGCQIHELIFHPANWHTATTAERYVREALEMWEPRISVEEIIVTPANDGEGQLIIDIKYQIKGQPDKRSLVYPFYLVPQDEGQEQE
jgi:uncharacterized protein